MRKLFISIGVIVLSTASLADEIGSFYLKGNIAANKMRDAKQNHSDISAKNTKSKSEISPTFGLGVGYYINDNIRTDLTFDYSDVSFKKGQTNFGGLGNNPGEIIAGQVSFNRSADIYSLMLNGYVDVITADNFSIFLGGGMGAAQIREKLEGTITGAALVGNIVTRSVNVTKNFTSKRKTNFAYSFTVGSAIKVSPVLDIDISYSWRDFGDAKHKSNKVVGPVTKNRYNGHVATVGFRINT